MTNEIVRLSNMRLRVDTKQINDGGSDTVTDAANGKVVKYNKLFADIDTATATPLALDATAITAQNTNGPHCEVHRVDEPYPTEFTVRIRATKGASAGSLITGDFSWAARGVEGVVQAGEDTAPPEENPPPPPPPPLPSGTSQLTAVWANNGEDKVCLSDTRASNGQNVINSVWNGTRVKLFGAKNETIGCALVLESKVSTVSNIEVIFTALSGPGATTIGTVAQTGNGVFNYVGRNIELFYAGYLEFRGLSKLHYHFDYDERHVPTRCQRPWTGNGAAVSGTTFASRPDHNKYYPEILYPIEVKTPFSITAGNTQSIWIDVYVPKTAAAGLHTGTITIKESGVVTRSIPVEFTVRNFTLPDVPSAKVMAFVGNTDIHKRWLGHSFLASSAEDLQMQPVREEYFKMLKRHGLLFFDDAEGSVSGYPAQRAPVYWDRIFSGATFSTANGYDGRGVSLPQNFYIYGAYGVVWAIWSPTSQSNIETNSTALENWFAANWPNVDRMVYIADENPDYTFQEQVAGWLKNQAGNGKNLHRFATMNWGAAISSVPSMDRVSWWFVFGDNTLWSGYQNTLVTAGREAGLYNSHRPNYGSLATEDDGTAPRCIFWAMFKKSIPRWFFWDTNYYNDYQTGAGDNNLFHNMKTFGLASTTDASAGDTGYLHSNGDGVLLYPGTDVVFPADSVGINGPMASWRLKLIRRGIQDFDYLTLATVKSSSGTNALVTSTLPATLWETGVTDLMDPSYHYEAQTWSSNPDVWEASRASLATIIES